DPRREGRAEDERLPGEPEPPALDESPRRLDPGPGDPGERRALHPRSDGEPGESRRALLRHGARPDPAGRGAPDRACVLPGGARPGGAGAGARGAGRRPRSAHTAVVARPAYADHNSDSPAV